MANLILRPNYSFLPGIEMVSTGTDDLPEGPVFFALNHSDSFSYWPFQYHLWQKLGRFTAPWVKGKNFEHWFVGNFLGSMNSIPVPSKGYIITRDFFSTVGRRPTDEEYKRLRAHIDRSAAIAVDEVPEAIFQQKRNMLGRVFDPAKETYREAARSLLDDMMALFVDLNVVALQKRCDLLVFPQGSRSLRLSRGRTGIAQLAMHLGRPIVPVGCNGGDVVYPGKSPIAKKGRIEFRFGKPFTRAEIMERRPGEPFRPFSPEADRRHGPVFQHLVDDVMDRLNTLLDERYRFTENRESQGSQGTARFL